MTNPEEYLDQIAEIMSVDAGEGESRTLKLSFNWETAEEANLLLKRVRQQQKELRLLKKRVDQDIKTIRQKANEDKDDVAAGFFSSLLGKGAARSDVAAKKRKITARQDAEIEPCNEVKLSLDNVITKLDGLKLEIETWLAKNK